MGYYKNNLEKFETTGLKIWEILCAAEVNIKLPKLSDEQFEYVVDFVYDWVMNSDIMPAELANLIAEGLADKDFTLNDFENFDGAQKITEVLNSKI